MNANTFPLGFIGFTASPAQPQFNPGTPFNIINATSIGMGGISVSAPGTGVFVNVPANPQVTFNAIGLNITAMPSLWNIGNYNFSVISMLITPTPYSFWAQGQGVFSNQGQNVANCVFQITGSWAAPVGSLPANPISYEFLVYCGAYTNPTAAPAPWDANLRVVNPPGGS
jgi:hypothetical protein